MSKMKLKNLIIKNFKCIEDSTEFTINQVTFLVGKNESGKTAILEALYKLNPVESDKANFDELEYPRRFVTNYRKTKESDTNPVLTSKWELENVDYNYLNEKINPKIKIKPNVIVTKGYDNIRRWSIDFEDSELLEEYINTSNFNAAEKAQISQAKTINELIKKIQELSAPTEKHSELLNRINSDFNNKSIDEYLRDVIKDRLPKFLYFDVYHKLPGRIALTDLKTKIQQNKLSFSDRIFLALLNMTSSSIEEVENIGKSEKLIMELEAIENNLTDEIFKYWTQNKHLEVEFRFDHSSPDDPPPFNQGFIFSTRIENRRHRASVNFDERSTGFIWFFSFLIWLSQVKRNYGDNIIILLDEPGLSLHGKAQKDLLRYINEKLRPNHQVIYTAHSPFMIDIDHIFSLRTVEDVVEIIKEEDDYTERILGTKVGEKILSRDKDTLFPLQGILGFDIAQTMFVGPYVVVVEGPTEASLFNWFSRQLIIRKREGLDIRWAVCPAESASKISSFVTLFLGRGLKIAAVFDYHNGQKGIVDKFIESELLPPENILKTTSFVDQNEADIEDLMGREMYIHLVNKAMNLTGQYSLKKKKPTNSNLRLVKEVEDHCNLLPVNFPTFNHYFPISYLSTLSSDEIENLPGLDFGLNKFEELFNNINKLI
ncbi:MAG: AAA family ATPase [Candidatus Lokiarchaeota archaeon]|nr:AAA family ATPase [Candidatus Lokiarchaeota archaeon]